MKAADITSMSMEEVRQELEKSRVILMEQRMAIWMKQSNNTAEMKNTKKRIAQLEGRLSQLRKQQSKS